MTLQVRVRIFEAVLLSKYTHMYVCIYKATSLLFIIKYYLSNHNPKNDEMLYTTTQSHFLKNNLLQNTSSSTPALLLKHFSYNVNLIK